MTPHTVSLALGVLLGIAVSAAATLLLQALRVRARHTAAPRARHLAASRRHALMDAVTCEATTCALCGTTPELLHLVEFYDDASWMCHTCARLFVVTPEAA